MSLISEKAGKLTHARQDAASLLAPIFTHVGKVKGERPKDTVYYTYNGATITFKLFEKLDATEQSILFGIVALASLEKRELPENGSEAVQGLLQKLNKVEEGGFEYGASVGFKTTYHALLQASGMGRSQQSKDRLLKGLERLEGARYIVKKGTKRHAGENLIAVGFDEQNDEIFIGLSSILAYAMENQFTYVNLQERKQLGSNLGITHLVHSRLCAVINAGSSHKFNVDKLSHTITGKIRREVEDDGSFQDVQLPFSKAELKNVRRQVVSAMRKINELEGWSATAKGSGSSLVYTVHRPSIKFDD